MMKPYSISAHFGTKMSRNHNIRNRKITDKEEHIDKDGYFQIIEDTPIQQAYYDTFGRVVLEYNARQQRSDRRIVDYYNKVVQDHKRNDKRNPAPAYEVILTVGNKDNHPSKKRSEELLRAYLDQFKKNNPNVVVFGAYFHADEPGSAPHMHVDYFFVKRENKRGLSLQVGQEGALREMGFKTEGNKKDKSLVTAQTKWQRAQRELLRSMAKERGMIVQDADEQDKGALEHLDTKIFKRQTELKEIEDKIQEQQRWEGNAKVAAENARLEQVKAENELEQLREQIIYKKVQIGDMEALKKENDELKEKNSFLERSINVLQRAFDFATKWMKKINLFGKFKEAFANEQGEQEWRDFIDVRQNMEINEALLQKENDILDGTNRDAPMDFLLEDLEQKLKDDATLPTLELEEEDDLYDETPVLSIQDFDLDR